MGIAEHSSTPAVTIQAMSGATTCTSRSFSPPANSLVVVCVAWMFTGKTTGTSLAVTDNLNNIYAQGTATLDVAANDTAIFIFFYTSAPGSITVTASRNSGSPPGTCLLAPRVLTGASALQPGSAVSDANDAEMKIAVTQTGSAVYAVGASPKHLRPAVPDSTLNQLAAFIDGQVHPGLGSVPGTTNQAAVGMRKKLTSVPGKVWTGWTGGMAQGCALEILPSPAVTLGTAGQPGAQWDTGQVLASNDVNTWIMPLGQEKIGGTNRKNTLGNADPDLQLPLVSSGTWAVRGVIFTDGPSSANISISFGTPPGATFYWTALYQNASGFNVLEARASADQVTANETGNGSLVAVLIDGTLIMGATPGTLSLQWGQATLNTSAATTVDQNSYLIAWRLG